MRRLRDLRAYTQILSIPSGNHWYIPDLSSAMYGRVRY
jgi:hypothetical protein